MNKSAGKAQILAKLLKAVNPFGRQMELHSPQISNAARIALGAGAGYAASDPLSDHISKYTLGEGDKLTPVDRASEKIINMLIGGTLAARGGVVGNPHLARTLSSKALLLSAPTGVHYLMGGLKEQAGMFKHLNRASNELNTDMDGTGKPALRVVMESLGGASQQGAEIVKQIGEKGPGAVDRLEQMPANATDKMLGRFGAGMAPVLGGVTGAAAGSLLGSVLADKERTPDDIRNNDRRKALLTLALGGLGAGGGWAAAHPSEVGQGLDQARAAAGGLLGNLRTAGVPYV